MSDDNETVLPTSQLDLQRRLDEDRDKDKDSKKESDEVYAPYATEDTDVTHYLGTSPEYMTHADVLNQPFAAEDGPEAEALKILKDASDQDVPKAERKNEEPKAATPTVTAPTAAATSPAPPASPPVPSATTTSTTG
jgi:hypothetical protein